MIIENNIKADSPIESLILSGYQDTFILIFTKLV